MTRQTQFLNSVYYFGCWQRSGHYLHSPGMRSAYGTGWHDRMEMLDGKLAPRSVADGKLVPMEDQVEFKAKFWRLTGYTPISYSALSWWDRSVDTRGGCNSIMFIPGHTIEAEAALQLACEQFPQVMSRLPAIEILPGVFEKTRAAPEAKEGG